MLFTAPVLWGQHAVNDDGSFNYNVDIDLPGPEGILKPNLSLTYNSNVPNGLLGTGWLMSGLSQISVLKNRVLYGPDNKVIYALDGMELFRDDSRVSSGEGYRTKLDSYKRINYLPYEDVWKVVDKQGTVFLFGRKILGERTTMNTSSLIDKLESELADHSWLLTQVISVNGDTYTISYNEITTSLWYSNNDGSLYYPNQIVYNNINTIDFKYEDREDFYINRLSTMPSHMELSSYSRRLESIDIKINSISYKSYEFDYEYSNSSGNSLLSSILEVGYGSTLYPGNPVSREIASFSWQSNESGTDVVETPFSKTQLNNFMGAYYSSTANIIPGDYNGDGHEDFIRQEIYEQAYIYLSNGDGTFQDKTLIEDIDDLALGYGSNSDSVNIIPGDFNGDGMTDFIRQENGAHFERFD